MSDQSAALLDQYRRNLQLLERQAAIYAPSEVPLKLQNDLQDTRTKIAELERGAIPPLVAPLEGKAGILIDHSHGQRHWPRPGRLSPLDGDLARLAALGAPLAAPAWQLAAVSHAAQFDPTQLSAWRGMILTMPWRQQLAEPTCRAIVEWVHAGGRLLLLGYEMGERHHGSNINALAISFGLHFNADIVAPPDWQPSEKPYDDTIMFDGALLRAHPTLADVSRLTLANLCTLTFDPGTQPLISLHDPTRPDPQIAWLRAEDAAYPNGTLTTPGKRRYDAVAPNALSTVCVAAAPGLCGAGAVLALGTWDIFGPNGSFTQGSDNLVFWRNMLEWLAMGDGR